MTYVSLYKKSLDSTIETYKSMCMKAVDGINLPISIPTNIVDLLEMQEDVRSKVSKLQSTSFPHATFDAKSTVEAHYNELESKNEAERVRIRSEAEQEKQVREDMHNKQVEEDAKYNESLIKDYKKKYTLLLGYKEDLQEVFDYYEITPVDMKISDGISAKEYAALIDNSIRVCRKYSRSNYRRVFDIIVKPIKGVTDLPVTLGYTFLLLCITYVALPVVSLLLFFNTIRSIMNMHTDKEALAIASTLMTTTDFNRFVDEDAFRRTEDVLLDDIEQNAQTQIESLPDYTEEREIEVKKAIQDSGEIQRLLTAAEAEVKSYLADKLDKATAIQSKVDQAINDFLSTYIKFPTQQNDSVVFDRNFVLGTVKGRIDVRVNVPVKNIIFDITDRDWGLSMVKLYLSNALLAVRVKQLTVEIIDPLNMCADFSEFFTPETKMYIKTNEKDVRKTMEACRTLAQENVIKLKGKTIDQYNAIAEERETVPIPYKLLIFVSGLKDLNEGREAELFKEFVCNSAEQGVQVWLCDTHEYPGCIYVHKGVNLVNTAYPYTTNVGDTAVETYRVALEHYKDRGIDYIEKFGNIFIPRDKWWTFDTIHGIKMPYGLENGDPTRGLNVALEIGDGNVHALLGGATGAGKSACINQLLVSLITMYPPSELVLVYVDFKNVEAAKFTRGYDKEVKDWLDPTEEQHLREQGTFYNRVSRIPHIQLISGTTDGGYALSVFDYIMKEMQRRQELINKAGVEKIETLRLKLLEQYNTEHDTKCSWAEMRKDWDWYYEHVYKIYGDLPRLLIVFDEYQVMYNTEFVPQKIIDQINGKITAITKLARAMSCHFWFTSQSMKGTMSKDTMGNFSLRGALRCAADVSEELLGNNAASTITAKFGFMYTNDSAGQDKNSNRFWRVPFLGTDHKSNDTRDLRDMFDYIDKLNDMLTEFNETHRMAEFYDEKILVPAYKLQYWYSQYTDSFSDPRMFVLGERASYSTNKAPITFGLVNDTGENVMVAAFERSDLMNLALTLIDNIRQSPNAQLVINCQDKDTHTLMAVDELVREEYYNWSLPNYPMMADEDSDDYPGLLNIFKEVIESREEDPSMTKDPIYFVLIQWERADLVCTNVNYRVQDMYKDLLRRGPVVGAHFIFVCKEKLEMPKLMINACNHHITGLMPEASAMYFSDDTTIKNLPSAAKDAGLFAVYEYGTTNYKFRIYQHEFTRQLQSREVVIN